MLGKKKTILQRVALKDPLAYIMLLSYCQQLARLVFKVGEC
jgi:hypothetical protein